MAVWKGRVAGHEVRIHNVDHGPPHCHAMVGGRDVQIELYEFCVLHPPPNSIPANLRNGLRDLQAELLQAWDRVKIIPAGSSPGVW